ncbi:MAG: GTPase HflX [Halanaerobiales bacterium]|nr:GTPase HflX [Halanaerobiales bacterium]
MNFKKDNENLYKIKNRKENALLVSDDETSIKELGQLADTSGVHSIKYFTYRLDKINPAYYIGKGNLEKIKEIINNYGINLVIFDNQLSPAQLRNIEEELGVKILDRNQLIMDIFALHAQSKESKIQVELAQLEYLLPRLVGRGEELSRLAGGIGTRGPGETKLEVDRRRIEKKIHRLKEKLKDIKGDREVQRKSRKDPIISLVGYTNAGKTTILNFLTGDDSLVEDQLFATLDSRARSYELPNGKNVIITDTVGFIKNLPHQLIASFRSTLEEITEADLILHIIDASDEEVTQKINVVEKELIELGIQDKPIQKVFNKIDLIDSRTKKDLEIQYPEAIFISAEENINTKRLRNKLCDFVEKSMNRYTLEIPYDDANIIETLHNRGIVEKEKYKNEFIFMDAFIPNDLSKKLEKYIVKNKG